MKNIEEQITTNFFNFDGKTKKLSVRDAIINHGDYVSYRLWNSNIVIRFYGKNDLVFSFCGYQTNMTKSRINAFLKSYRCTISQKNYTLYLRDAKGKNFDIDPCKKYCVSSDGAFLGEYV